MHYYHRAGATPEFLYLAKSSAAQWPIIDNAVPLAEVWAADYPDFTFAAAKKKDRDGGKKDDVKAKLKIVLQLRSLRFKRKYHIIATFPQENF